jgi:hypothetical protein
VDVVELDSSELDSTADAIKESSSDSAVLALEATVVDEDDSTELTDDSNDEINSVSSSTEVVEMSSTVSTSETVVFEVDELIKYSATVEISSSLDSLSEEIAVYVSKSESMVDAASSDSSSEMIYSFDVDYSSDTYSLIISVDSVLTTSSRSIFD